MAIVYTNSWDSSRSDSYDLREFSTVATVIATAGEVLTPTNVLTATEQTTGVPLPVVGQVYLPDTRYFVQRIGYPRLQGPRFAEVAISYKLGRGSGEQEEEDPLAVPVRYRVRNGVNSEATDADVEGKPLLNSAGDPFSGTIQTNIAAIYVDAVRNEAAYNFPQAIRFTNKVNADSFSLAGQVINAGEAYCLGIQPEQEFSLVEDYVTVVYSFEIRDRLLLQNGSRLTAFIHRLLDKGQRGWAYNMGQDESKQEIATANGDASEPSVVTGDVLLKDGIPLERSSYVTLNPNFDDDDGRGWVPQPPPGRAPNATRDIDPNTQANFLLYRKHFEDNFGQLGLP